MRLKTTAVSLLVATMFLLLACSEEILEYISEGNGIMASDNMTLDETEPHNQMANWENAFEIDLQYQGTFDGPVGWSLQLDTWFSVFEFEITLEAALEIVNAILRHTLSEESYNDIIPVVTENTEENTFVVSYTLATTTEFHVTLDRKDAQILQVYYDGKIDFTITQELALEIGDAALRLVFGERVFKDAVFVVAEVVRDDAFAVWRIPRNELGSDGEFPLAVISNIDGRIIQIGHG